MNWLNLKMIFCRIVDEDCIDAWNSVFTKVRGKGSMTYAPTTNAPARNANVEAYINPDPNPNPNPNPNPYPALNQKPNHTHESNSVFGEVSMPEQLSPEHMSCHLSSVLHRATPSIDRFTNIFKFMDVSSLETYM